MGIDKYICLIFLLCWPALGLFELSASPYNLSGSEFQFIFDNDTIVGGTDQYYTAGARLEQAFYYEKGDPGNEGSKGPPLLFSKLLQRKNVQNVFQGVSIGGEMYTPTNIEKTEVAYGDRPYSAWSFFGVFWGLNLDGRTRSTHHRFDFEYGGVGANANGGAVQILVHDIFPASSGNPEGWGQLSQGENGVRLTYEYSNLSRVKNHSQSGFEIKAALGTVNTDLNLGWVYKRGYLETSSLFKKSREFKINMVVNPSLTLVGYDAHLDGTYFSGGKVQVKSYDFMDYAAFDLLAGDANPVLKFHSYHPLFTDQTNYPRYERYNYYNRYLTLYAPIFNRDNHSTFASAFSTYSVLFNQNETLDNEAKRIILLDVALNPVQDPLELLFIYQHLESQGKPMNVFLKFAAFQTMVVRSNLRNYDSTLHIWIYRQLFQKKNPAQTYTVKKRKYFGNLRLGFTVDYGRFTFSLMGNFSTQEFLQKNALPGRHVYGTIALAYRW